MPITYNVYSATADQTAFVIPFLYLETSHVKVTVNGVEHTNEADEPLYTVNTGTNSVDLDSGATLGESVKVYRETPGRSETAKVLLVDFQDGSVLTEADLDKATLQLLYLAQEAEETGASSLPVDWDGNYDAGGKRIKNIDELAGSVGDAASVGYVEGLALYGQGATVPQSWSRLGSNFTGTTGNCTLILTVPVPSSDSDQLFIVSLNGLIQRATTDFTVSESGGVYTLTLIMGSEILNSGDVVNIANFGVSRQVNTIAQPLTPTATDAVGMTLQGFDANQSGDMLVIEESDGTNVFSVGTEGVTLSPTSIHIVVGDHTNDLLNTEINEKKVEVGDWDYTSSSIYGVVVQTSGADRGNIGIQGTSGASVATSALGVHHGANSVFGVKYSGNVSCGEVAATGDLTINDGSSDVVTLDKDAGNISADGYLRLGDATTATAGAGDLTCKEIYTEGLAAIGGGTGAAGGGLTLNADGSLQADSWVRSAYLRADAGATGGLECQDTSVKGNVWFTPQGPAMDYDNSGGTANRGWIKSMATRVLVGGSDGLDIGGDGGPSKIANVLCTTSSDDTNAATKGFVDSKVRVDTLAVATGDDTGNLLLTAPDGDAFANYYKLELIFEGLTAGGANKGPALGFYKQSDPQVYYNVTPTGYNMDKGEAAPETGFGANYIYNDSTYGTGIRLGKNADADFTLDADAVYGVVTITGHRAGQIMHVDYRLHSQGFDSTSGYMYYHRLGHFDLGGTTSGLEALTGIRFLFASTSGVVEVRTGTLRVVGYKD